MIVVATGGRTGDDVVVRLLALKRNDLLIGLIESIGLFCFSKTLRGILEYWSKYIAALL